MKKIGKLLVGLLMAIVMVLGLVGCAPTGTDSTGSSSSKPSGSTGSGSTGSGSTGGDSSSTEEVPADEGPFSDNIFEAEAAEYSGVSSNNSGSFGHACVARSYVFDTSFSGNISLRNVAPPNEGSVTENSLKFTFTSDKAVKVNMEVSVASRYDSTPKWQEMNFSTMYTTVVNGKYPSLDVVVPAGDATQIVQGNNYTAMQLIEFPITLQEGENTIEFIALDKACNLDYINIKTSAKLTGWEDHYWSDTSVISISKAPSETATGTITFSCKETDCTTTQDWTLPALTDDAYIVDDSAADKTVYSLELMGEEVTIAEVAKGTVDPEPEPEPEPEGPQDVTADINFFAETAWGTFSPDGTNTGADTKREAGDLKTGADDALHFTAATASRINMFDKAKDSDGKTHNIVHTNATETSGIFGYEYKFDMDMTATGNFDIILFATAKIQTTYVAADYRAVWLSFADGTLTLRVQGDGKDAVQATATVPANADITSFSVAITRYDATTCLLKVYVNGEAVTLTKAPTATYGSVVKGCFTFTANGWGQRFGVSPAADAEVVISSFKATKSEDTFVMPSFTAEKAALTLVDGKPYLVVENSFSGLNDSEVVAYAEGISADIQEIDVWTTYADEISFAEVKNGKCYTYIAIDDLAVSEHYYFSHYNGNNFNAPVSQEASELTVSYLDKVYTLSQLSGQSDNWKNGLAAIKVTQRDGYSASITSASIAEQDGKAVFTATGSYEGYGKAEVEAFAYAFKLNGGLNESGKYTVSKADAVITVDEDAKTFTVVIDVTDYEKDYYMSQLNGADVKLGADGAALDGTSITVEDKVYTIWSKDSDGGTNTCWGCLTVVVSDVAADSGAEA